LGTKRDDLSPSVAVAVAVAGTRRDVTAPSIFLDTARTPLAMHPIMD
jgi:hypothetical protein